MKIEMEEIFMSIEEKWEGKKRGRLIEKEERKGKKMVGRGNGERGRKMRM